LAIVVLAAACGGPAAVVQPTKAITSAAQATSPTPSPSSAVQVPTATPEPLNVYSATINGQLSPIVANDPLRVYVPNSNDGAVDVIDPATFQVVARLAVGRIPHHIAPAWDLTRLYVDNEGSSSFSVIDPATAQIVGTIPMAHPYNLYFTPDGTRAIVVAERLQRLDFYDPHTWKPLGSLQVPWRGVDHLDFSADGSFLLASTEWTGMVVRIDVATIAMTGSLAVGGLPIDVRLAPDGSVFYVANQGRHGVSVIDPVNMREVQFIPTGRGAHGLEISRDTRSIYVSNRLAGTVSVIDLLSRAVTATWVIGGSPDMMALSPDGSQLWISGRYDRSVYVIDTTTGAVLHRIAVGGAPHGLTFFPNPGRFSLGHNGVYR